MGAEYIVSWYVCPILMAVSAVLVLPFPRFIKRITHWFVDLHFPSIIRFRLGSIFIVILTIASVTQFLPYFNGLKEEHQNHQRKVP